GRRIRPRTDELPIEAQGLAGAPIAGCRAGAARGPAAATPPSAASNSRRAMVTVIRPSRARCVKGKIPRHERAVPPDPAWAGRLDFKRFIFGRAVGRVLINAGF